MSVDAKAEIAIERPRSAQFMNGVLRLRPASSSSVTVVPVVMET